jgi:hypothetical protein
MCEAFDMFADATKSGSETWDAFLQRLHADYLQDDPSHAFEVLLWILKNKKSYVYQNLAGTLLLKFEIPCRIGINEFMEVVLHNFNASAKGTVRYLVKCFGQSEVKAKALALRASHLTTDQSQNLDCLMYWLGEQPAGSS